MGTTWANDMNFVMNHAPGSTGDSNYNNAFQMRGKYPYIQFISVYLDPIGILKQYLIKSYKYVTSVCSNKRLLYSTCLLIK